jgi:hypothetical protein
VNSTQVAFDTQHAEIAQLSSRVVWLERVLASYGPEAGPVRATVPA